MDGQTTNSWTISTQQSSQLNTAAHLPNYTTEVTVPAPRFTAADAEEAIRRLESEIVMLKDRLAQTREQLAVVERTKADKSEMSCLNEAVHWLHQRYDEMQRIFDFDAMIINGIQK